MKLFCITFIFLAITSSVYPQLADTINRTDTKGMKQGYWIKKYPNGNRQYEGYFRNDKPVGILRRYFDTDTLRSVMMHKPDGKTVETIIYHPNGYIASKGTFVNQIKEGIWEFYSSASKNHLMLSETYHDNLKDGETLKYYPSGAILEKMNYSKDIKNGSWTQYYPDGRICLKTNYVNGKLEGKFEVLYPDGKPQYTGVYRNDSRDGKWKVFNTDGSLKKEIEYVMGKAKNPELIKEETEYLDALEKNKGKIADPEKTGTIW
ncbi:MAG: toxin-antitoxin system YwqK family antitoxin [Bacteroidales bacterium]